MKRILGPLLQNWFLICLFLLSLGAIPGLVLVILALLGMDGAINEWLLENAQITYQLTLSPWVTLLLLLMPLLLVVLYFLKLKRKPLYVPSTFLWKKSIEDLHVNSLFQWLRNNILLLLQLLILLFLIYSVLGLRFHGNTSVSRHYILLIDNSASMSAKDVLPNRLEWAKQEARKEIDAARDDDSGMVIVFNSKATTLQTYTNDKGKLRAAIDSIAPTERPTRIEEALALAESLANPVRSTEDLASQPDNVRAEQQRTMVTLRGISTVVHFFSDGRFAKLSEATLANLNSRLAGNVSALGNINLHYHMAGKITEAGNTNNLAIVGFNVLRQPVLGKKASGVPAQQLLAFVRLANFRSSKSVVKVKLDIYVNGQLAHPMQEVREIRPRTYTPGKGDEEEKDEPGETDVKFALPLLRPSQNIVLHAHLDKPEDDFPLDDEAWLAVGTTRKAKVLVVGQPNSILDAFFEQEGTKKIASAERIAPAALKTDTYRKKANSGDVDLVVFDRCAPEDEADMPSAHTFFIDRPPPPWKRGKVDLKNPLMMPSKQSHPLLRYLTTIWDVRTHEAFVFDVKKNLDPELTARADLPDADPLKRNLPTLTRIIETSNHVPLLFTMPRGPYTDLVMTFALINDSGDLVTDWPLQTSFPIFFRNVLYILGNVDDSVRAVSVQPGEPVILRPEAGFNFLEVTDPANVTVRLPRGERNEVHFSDTEKVGIYRYAIGIQTQTDEKKHVEERDSLVRSFAVNLLDANESNIEPRSSIRIGNEEPIRAGEEKTQPRDIWKWILVLTLALLMAEWFIYHRRIAV